MKKILTPTNYEMIPLNELTNVRFYTSTDPGSYVASHWHDAVEILYLQEGSLTVTLENISFPVASGQCILIPPNQIHSTLCTSPNRAIVFQIPVSFIEKFIPDVKQLQFSLQDPVKDRHLQKKIELLKDSLLKSSFSWSPILRDLYCVSTVCCLKFFFSYIRTSVFMLLLRQRILPEETEIWKRSLLF